MAFWSGERLAVELARGLIEPFDAARIDCASYPLRVGGQAFVTSDRFIDSAPGDALVTMLAAPPQHTLRIPPGQFAFLLTHEVIKVPTNALALISIKAKYKFQGLINVSGFHVDPGWNGKLLFSVYNAGPTEVIIENEQTMFMIVYADLDQPSSVDYTYDGSAQGRNRIDPSLIQGMTSQVFSPLMLQRQMKALSSEVEAVSKDLGSEMAAVSKDLSSEMAAMRVAVQSVRAGSVTAITAAGLLLSAAALFAAFAPVTLGVILARVIDGAGYEMNLKSPEAARTANNQPATNAVAPSPSAAATSPTK